MLFASEINWCFKVVLFAYLASNLIIIYNNPTPYGHTIQLIFSTNEWIYSDQTSEVKYLKHKVILDCGLFLMVRLIREEKNKIIIIFSDQLSMDSRRLLRLIEKTN